MSRDYDVYQGDAIPHILREMEAESVDLTTTSVPFPALFAYTDSEADLGNSEELDAETSIHFSYFFRGLRRVMKPGRVAMIHCMQIPLTKRSGRKGLFDFRGLLIALGRRAGLTYDYDWLVTKNPQAQAIRTKSHKLQFSSLEKDRVNSRGALADYLIKFLAPGDNDVPVNSPDEVSRNNWIDQAEAAWRDIKETHTLNVRGTKGEGDTKHICPLQLGVVERLVKLYSNPGELVFDPFMGIGTVGFVALRLGRRAYGCELKPEYRAQAMKNMERGKNEFSRENRTLFDELEVAP